MSDAHFSLLDELVLELEGLLGALDDPEVDPRRAWERCRAAFERFRALRQADDAPLSHQAQARLQDAQRLHAVAADHALRARDELRAELEHVRHARRQLRAALAEGGTARACDLEG